MARFSLLDWYQNDPEDPYNWSARKKWIITAQLALSTWTVSFGSSVYSGGIQYTVRDLNVSYNVATLGISLYVLGFALGPLVFASIGEMYGRRIIFLITLSLYTLFQLQGVLAHNVPTLLSCRLLTGIFGSSPLTNAGGTVSDIWSLRERGLASAIYATVPFLGPVIGPIVGGYVVQNHRLGWHFNFVLIFVFSVLSLVTGYLFVPETYAPVLLRRRAEKLTKASNGAVHYVSIYDQHQSKSFSKVLFRTLSRPFLFLFTEPIVFFLSIYCAVLYGTLYALFSGFPIIFQHHRHFTPGEGGLAFIGVGFGITLGTASQSIQNRLYWKTMVKSKTGRAPPEARLHTAAMGAILAPIGLWWFAWTTKPSIHWIVPIFAGIPFGIGISQILQAVTTYLMDTYGVYFASAIAATVVLRSLCGAAFPLFSGPLFNSLGDEWAMSVFAILATVCMPIPPLLFKYGWWIRSKSHFAYHDPAPSEYSSQDDLRKSSLSTKTLTEISYSQSTHSRTCSTASGSNASLCNCSKFSPTPSPISAV
ncbi:major facilitator superfamily domain-containing protein [Crepidotus variabilis]|uniref:Major facilitator superfamily domain-containing protein n=1 Tax=Crepidotus variabilis TaxID=179855 RepID=A0A9P6ERI0_9AGAR|nr:major facilitator superfamily domain-containing protein [Crepidotus variabilis]